MATVVVIAPAVKADETTSLLSQAQHPGDIMVGRHKAIAHLVHPSMARHLISITTFGSPSNRPLRKTCSRGNCMERHGKEKMEAAFRKRTKLEKSNPAEFV